MNGDRKTSPWVYIGIGCLIVALLGVVGVGGALFVGYRWAKGVRTTIENPVARNEKVMEILGCTKLPEGYHAALAFSVPYLVDVAILSDKVSPTKEEFPGFREHGLLYVRAIKQPREQKELKAYIENKDPLAKPPQRRQSRIEAGQITLDVGEMLRKGIIETEGPRLLYAVQRGSVNVKGERFEGLAATILVDCKSDDKLREAIWFGPDPSLPKTTDASTASENGGEGVPKPRDRAPEGTADEAIPAGTPIDESAIREFMSHFSLCR